MPSTSPISVHAEISIPSTTKRVSGCETIAAACIKALTNACYEWSEKLLSGNKLCHREELTDDKARAQVHQNVSQVENYNKEGVDTKGGAPFNKHCEMCCRSPVQAGMDSLGCMAQRRSSQLDAMDETWIHY